MSTCFEPIACAQLTWRDGVPYSAQFNDIYFSTEHGLSETKHVFIDGNRLIERWKNLGDNAHFVIAECGFGTGLNVLLAWQHFKINAPKCAQLHFFSAEKHPLRQDDLMHCLGLWPEIAVEAKALLAGYPQILTPGFHKIVLEEGRVSLTLMLGDALDMFDDLLLCHDPSLEPALRPWFVDAWFLDGFSPIKNPGMWSKSLFLTMGLLSCSGTTLSTFSAAGFVRRGLEEVGFSVTKHKGHAKKRDMTVGYFQQLAQASKLRYTPWHVYSHAIKSRQEAIVIGAGLAGCFSAHALSKRGWHVTLIDQKSKIAQGASGNPQSVLYPNLSAFRAPLTTFMLNAFTHAVRVYKPWVENHLIQGELNGILQLAWNNKANQHFLSLTPWLSHYPELGLLVDSTQASALAGTALHHAGLFIPQAGWIQSQSLCEFLVQSPRIDCILNQSVEQFDFDDGYWHVGAHRAPVLIIATGFNATSYTQSNHLSLFPFKGQMTAVKTTDTGMGLNIPLCAKGHILPDNQGLHWIGATYRPGQIDSVCQAQDDDENMNVFDLISSNYTQAPTVSNHWAGVRAATSDYLPLVGPVAACSEFNAIFHSLKSNAGRFIPQAGAYQKGLYLCAGFGSRGLTTIPFSAEYLAAMIHKEPFGMSRAMAQSISPSRFLIRTLTRG